MLHSYREVEIPRKQIGRRIVINVPGYLKETHQIHIKIRRKKAADGPIPLVRRIKDAQHGFGIGNKLHNGSLSIFQ